MFRCPGTRHGRALASGGGRMVDDSGVTPLPRRVPGASGSPNPPVRVDPSAIPEDLRQRVLAAIATELEHDSAAAEQRRAQTRAGAAALRLGATAAAGLDATAAPDHAPPALPGRRLDAEAMTEPLPRIGGLGQDGAPGGAGTPDGLAAATPPGAAPPETAPSVFTPSEHKRPGTMPPDSVSPPPVAARRPRPGRPYRIAGLLLAVMLVAVGIIVLMMSSGGPKPRHHTGLGPAAPGTGAALREGAVTWVAGQVSRTAVVACDPVTCRALRSRGVPASSLDSLGPQTASPLRSQIIVATAAVRALSGTRLGSGACADQMLALAPGRLRVDDRH